MRQMRNITFVLLIVFSNSLAFANEKSSAEIKPQIHAYLEENAADKAWNLMVSEFGSDFDTLLRVCIDVATENNHAGEDRYLLNKAIEHTREVFKDRLILAEAYHRLGVENYIGDQYPEAVQNYQEAIRIRQKYASGKNFLIAKGYFNISMCFKQRNQYGTAIDYAEMALEKWPTDPIPKEGITQAELQRRTGKTLEELGFMYGKLKDVKKGELYLLRARSVYEDLYANDHRQLADLYNDIATFYVETDSASQIITYSELAIAQIESLPKKAFEDQEHLANSYNNLGIAYGLLGSSKSAFHYLNLSRKINEQYPAKRMQKLSYNFTNIALVHLYDQAYDQALGYYSKALQLDEQIGNSLEIAIDYGNIADLKHKQGKLVEALDYYQEAISLLISKNTLAVRSLTAPILEEQIALDRPRLVKYLHEKGEVLLALYEQQSSEKYLQAALENYQVATQLIGELRRDYLFDESKMFLSALAKPVYEGAIHANYIAYEKTNVEEYLETIFTFMEQSKAVVLLEAVRVVKANLSTAIPDELMHQIQRLKLEIAGIEKDLFVALNAKKGSSPAVKALRKELFEKNKALEEAMQTVEPLVSTTSTIDSRSTVELSDFQQNVLEEEQQFVSYFLGEKNMYIFHCSPYDAGVATVAADFPVKDWIDAMRNAIKLLNGYGSCEEQLIYQTQYVHHAWQLYAKLIAPIEAVFNAQQNVIIAPDGALGYIPFDALLSEQVSLEECADFEKLPYLLKICTPSYTYSATLLQEIRRMPRTNLEKELSVLAVAPKFQLAEAQQIALNTRGALRPLYFTTKEVKAILMHFKGTPLLDFEANKQNFLAALPNYRIIHIASHAKVNGQNSDFSFIAFSQNGDSINEEELLYLAELYGLQGKLQADMVVLSACETGIGGLDKGEGIISLARGFLYAGASSLITTLWSVEDKSSMELMSTFYENLDRGQSKDEALKNAKLQLMTGGKSPQKWAGYIAIGDMKPFRTGNSNLLYLLWGIGLGLLISLWFWSRRRELGND